MDERIRDIIDDLHHVSASLRQEEPKHAELQKIIDQIVKLAHIVDEHLPKDQ